MIKKLLQRNSFSPLLETGISPKLFSVSRIQKTSSNLLTSINGDKSVGVAFLCNTTQKTTYNVMKLAAVLLCALQLTACSKAPVTTPPSSPSQAKAVAVKPKPILKQASSAMRLPAPPVNQFDFSDKKDPFKPFVVVKAPPSNTTDAVKTARRNSLPIHSFDVNQFKLIGIITGGRENQAMVTDPGGKGYVLKIGMLIGKNDGKIISINSSGVDILEQFKDDNGRVRKENIKLTLPRKQ